MRSNLLSLQQIAKLQDSTQLRLSTGLKVNSAIDNPSSYYTASSLTNRAEDLSALLDSMGQSVQTIKAATEGIEKAEDLLSQMKAIAEQVNTGVYVPEKSYFEKLVGSNGAVVTNAEELRAAVDSGKEEICVYGKIDLGDISTTGGLELQENQKLVGVNYYGNFGTEGEEFSSISATATVKEKNLINISKANCLVSDLNLDYENSADSGNLFAINIQGQNIVGNLENLNIKTEFNGSEVHRAGIGIRSGAIGNLSGKINIQSSGQYAYGIYNAFNRSILNITANTQLNIKTDGTNGKGILTDNLATTNIMGGAYVNIKTTGNISVGIYTQVTGAETNIFADADVNIETSGTNSYGFCLYQNTKLNIMGNVKVTANNAIGFSIPNSTECHIGSSAQILLNTKNIGFYIEYSASAVSGLLDIAQGAKIAFEKDGNTSWYEVKDDYSTQSATAATKITADNFTATVSSETTEAWKTAGDVVKEQEQEKAAQAEKEAEEQANREVYQKQFNNALSQYDSLIKDSSYKGVNLLQADDLKVIFNENRSATLDVMGVDLSSDKIGMMMADWSKAKDVQTSLEQVINAKNTLRSASTKLGNYYSIITERETFTDNLINVLQEGADKLTLADMNEESANMLSLQTQQQLAINSLSLASQASQAVLRLF